jgi:hypothetical protein
MPMIAPLLSPPEPPDEAAGAAGGGEAGGATVRAQLRPGVEQMASGGRWGRAVERWGRGM